ncbi:hypothetical protein A7981_05605 [Methylovorus sp. MM2]|uniref:hypothetical protein n=1 Tax=Methylovorus sp. MM2 TaxID=1848038 RepID=UPI0007E19417|nr:hypothetical protein [Methylovorus sp. MM2]OAM52912.1 hypothetical protein A7981_05605 [Methylovorus sp. MM2]
MVEDILGNELKAGDTFAYSLPLYNTAIVVRVYKLLEITDTGRLKAECIHTPLNSDRALGFITSFHADQAKLKAVKLWLTFEGDKK